MPLTEINDLYRSMWTLENGFMKNIIMKSRYIEDRIIISPFQCFPNENKEICRTFEAFFSKSNLIF